MKQAYSPVRSQTCAHSSVCKIASMTKALIRNTKPEIILSVSDEYIDESDNTHFCDITWQWSDEHGNWASIEALGTIHASREPNSIDYTFDDAEAQFSDDTLTVNLD